MKRLLFFINPNAGHAEIRGTLMEVLEIVSAGGYEVTVHMTTGPRDITYQIAARGAQYDLIVCTGGDGTLNEAVSGLMALPYEKRPKLGYIPGGTVNDVMLTIVTGALGRHLRRRGVDTDGLVLKTMVPVSVRAELERGALGNRVAAMMAPPSRGMFSSPCAVGPRRWMAIGPRPLTKNQ